VGVGAHDVVADRGAHRHQQAAVERGEEEVEAVVGGRGVERRAEAALIGPTAVADHHQAPPVLQVVGVLEVGEVEQVENPQRVDVAGVCAEENLSPVTALAGVLRDLTQLPGQHREPGLQQQLLEGEDGPQRVGTRTGDVVDDFQRIDARGALHRRPDGAPGLQRLDELWQQVLGEAKGLHGMTPWRIS
jgi:hypothetical protein